MEDVNRLRDALETTELKAEREELIAEAREKADAAARAGAADLSAVAELDRIAKAEAERAEYASPAALRDRCLALCAQLVSDAETDPHAAGVALAALDCATSAANALDEIEARRPVPGTLLEARVGTAGINVERLTADVWNATQEAGHPTTVGDAAVDALRKVLS